MDISHLSFFFDNCCNLYTKTVKYILHFHRAVQVNRAIYTYSYKSRIQNRPLDQNIQYLRKTTQCFQNKTRNLQVFNICHKNVDFL